MVFTATLALDEAPARALADAIAADARLDAFTVDASEAAPGRWRVTVYFAGRPRRSTRAALAAVARWVLGKTAPPFAFAELPDTDWVARSLAGLAPVRVGRLLVHGRHDRDKVRANDLAIEIEAGQAFGTGHHGTTAGCLAAIDRLAGYRRIGRALDVGTGSGVLAIAIAKRCKAPVLASDNDPVAIAVATENARLNGVAGFVHTVNADGVGRHVFRANGPYDLIVANILAGPLVALAPAISRLAAPEGTVILSGILTGQQQRVAAIYRGLGLLHAATIVIDKWVTMVMRQPRKRRCYPSCSPITPPAGCSG